MSSEEVKAFKKESDLIKTVPGIGNTTHHRRFSPRLERICRNFDEAHLSS